MESRAEHTARRTELTGGSDGSRNLVLTELKLMDSDRLSKKKNTYVPLADIKVTVIISDREV